MWRIEVRNGPERSGQVRKWVRRVMQIGRVIGTVVATRKDPRFDGIRLMLVQPLTPAGEKAGRPLVAVDSVGAGAGERVFFVRGKEASFPFHPLEVPADAGIVGIVDHWTVPERAIEEAP